MHIALIPSPFVGALSWRPVAEILPDAVAVNYGGVSGPDWFEGAASRIAAQVDDRPWIASCTVARAPLRRRWRTPPPTLPA